MPALPSPVLGWRSSTDGLCPPLCSPTPSTLLRWAGSACLASAAPGSCCSLPASLSSAAQCPTRTRTPGAQPHQHQCPAGLFVLPHTHLTPAHGHSSLCLAHCRGLQARLMGICGHSHLQLWPTAWLKVASHRKPLPSTRMRLCQTQNLCWLFSYCQNLARQMHRPGEQKVLAAPPGQTLPVWQSYIRTIFFQDHLFEM